MLLLGTALCLLLIGFFIPAIPQSQAYHDFADQRSMFGIPNAWNVLSNFPFAIAGIWGLCLLSSPSKIQFIDSKERWLWFCISLGLILVALGSGYYHLAPDNARLFWDRLPMALVFMSFVAALIFDRINARLGFFLWPILLMIGILSVLQWHFSELRGYGDLRFYAGVQAFTGLMAIVMLLLPSHYTRTKDIAIILLCYGLAKLFEIFDNQIHDLSGNIVSGHSLKHLAAGLAGLWMIGMMWKRQRYTHPGRTKK